MKRDPNMMADEVQNAIAIQPRTHPMTDFPTEFDNRIVTRLYTCPICLGKLLNPYVAKDHITQYHRMSMQDLNRLGKKINIK